MAFNKAREERKWKIRKEAEENLMRKLGTDEEIIKQLRRYDWKDFKADRLFYHRLAKTGTCIDHLIDEEREKDICTVDELLESIENEKLYMALCKEDKLMLKILLYRINGYSNKDVSKLCGLSYLAVNNRIWYFRKKFKNIL